MSFGLGGEPASSQSLFGAQQSSQSLFGAAAQSSQSIFGAPQSSQSGFGAPQSSQSPFGAVQSPPSLFGAPASSQSLFGAAQPSPSIFGSASSQSIFASSQSIFASSQSLFASSQSLFASSQSLFGDLQSGSSLFPQQQQQQQQQQQPPPQLPRNVTTLIEKLNPLHPDSSFHTFLYNLVPPSDVARYTRPQAMDQALWDEAQAKNPDPSRFVPVQANLFDDLLQRADIQTKRVKSHGTVLSRMEKDLAAMYDSIDTDIKPKLATSRRRHRELARKLLRVACRVEAVTGAGGLSLTEADRKCRLKALATALSAPAEFKDKLSDLVELADAALLGRSTAPSVAIRDPHAATVIRDLLTDQLKGIEQLAAVCERADRDIVIMAESLQER